MSYENMESEELLDIVYRRDGEVARLHAEASRLDQAYLAQVEARRKADAEIAKLREEVLHLASLAADGQELKLRTFAALGLADVDTDDPLDVAAAKLREENAALHKDNAWRNAPDLMALREEVKRQSDLFGSTLRDNHEMCDENERLREQFVAAKKRAEEAEKIIRETPTMLMQREYNTIKSRADHAEKLAAAQRLAFEDMRATYEEQTDALGEKLRLASNARIDAEKRLGEAVALLATICDASCVTLPEGSCGRNCCSAQIGRLARAFLAEMEKKP